MGKLYCNTVYWVAVYCNTLHCIVAGRAAGVKNHIAIQNCIVTGGMGIGQALGAGAGRAGRWAQAAMRVGAERHGLHGAQAQAGVRGALQQVGARARGTAGTRACGAGMRACGAGARTRHERAGARCRRRQGRAGRQAGRPVRVWCAQLGQVGCFGAPDSVFGLV